MKINVIKILSKKKDNCNLNLSDWQPKYGRETYISWFGVFCLGKLLLHLLSRNEHIVFSISWVGNLFCLKYSFIYMNSLLRLWKVEQRPQARETRDLILFNLNFLQQ